MRQSSPPSGPLCLFPVDAGNKRPLTYFYELLRRMKRRQREFSMPEGYCVKCKAKKEIVDAVEVTTKNGRKAIKGKCPTCGTVMYKILGGKAAPTAAATAESAKPPST
jgi:hypothetical protein